MRGLEFQALLTDQDKVEIAELQPDHVGLTNEEGTREYQEKLVSFEEVD